MCTNEIEYATTTTFMFPRCERVRLSCYNLPTRTQYWGAHHGAVAEKPPQNKRVPKKIEKVG